MENIIKIEWQELLAVLPHVKVGAEIIRVQTVPRVHYLIPAISEGNMNYETSVEPFS